MLLLQTMEIPFFDIIMRLRENFRTNETLLSFEIQLKEVFVFYWNVETFDFKRMFNLISDWKLYFYNYNLNEFSLSPKHHMYNVMRGWVKPFRSKLKLIGLRYRIMSIQQDEQKVWINVGLSHFVGLDMSRNYIYIQKHPRRKHALKLRSWDRAGIFVFFFLVRRFRGPNPFTGNGIRLLGEKPRFVSKRKMR